MNNRKFSPNSKRGDDTNDRETPIAPDVRKVYPRTPYRNYVSPMASTFRNGQPAARRDLPECDCPENTFRPYPSPPSTRRDIQQDFIPSIYTGHHNGHRPSPPNCTCPQILGRGPQIPMHLSTELRPMPQNPFLNATNGSGQPQCSCNENFPQYPANFGGSNFNAATTNQNLFTYQTMPNPANTFRYPAAPTSQRFQPRLTLTDVYDPWPSYPQSFPQQHNFQTAHQQPPHRYFNEQRDTTCNCQYLTPYFQNLPRGPPAQTHTVPYATPASPQRYCNGNVCYLRPPQNITPRHESPHRNTSMNENGSNLSSERGFANDNEVDEQPQTSIDEAILKNFIKSSLMPDDGPEGGSLYSNSAEFQRLIENVHKQIISMNSAEMLQRLDSEEDFSSQLSMVSERSTTTQTSEVRQILLEDTLPKKSVETQTKLSGSQFESLDQELKRDSEFLDSDEGRATEPATTILHKNKNFNNDISNPRISSIGSIQPSKETIRSIKKYSVVSSSQESTEIKPFACFCTKDKPCKEHNRLAELLSKETETQTNGENISDEPEASEQPKGSKQSPPKKNETAAKENMPSKKPDTGKNTKSNGSSGSEQNSPKKGQARTESGNESTPLSSSFGTTNASDKRSSRDGTKPLEKEMHLPTPELSDSKPSKKNPPKPPTGSKPLIVVHHSLRDSLEPQTASRESIKGSDKKRRIDSPKEKEVNSLTPESTNSKPQNERKNKPTESKASQTTFGMVKAEMRMNENLKQSPSPDSKTLNQATKKPNKKSEASQTKITYIRSPKQEISDDSDRESMKTPPKKNSKKKTEESKASQTTVTVDNQLGMVDSSLEHSSPDSKKPTKRTSVKESQTESPDKQSRTSDAEPPTKSMASQTNDMYLNSPTNENSEKIFRYVTLQAAKPSPKRSGKIKKKRSKTNAIRKSNSSVSRGRGTVKSKNSKGERERSRTRSISASKSRSKSLQRKELPGKGSQRSRSKLKDGKLKKNSNRKVIKDKKRHEVRRSTPVDTNTVEPSFSDEEDRDFWKFEEDFNLGPDYTLGESAER